MDLVGRLLKRNPDERIALIKVFIHPWIRHIANLEQIPVEVEDNYDETDSYYSNTTTPAASVNTYGVTPGQDANESCMSIPGTEHSID